jgi:hypothetical protein
VIIQEVFGATSERQGRLQKPKSQRTRSLAEIAERELALGGLRAPPRALRFKLFEQLSIYNSFMKLIAAVLAIAMLASPVLAQPTPTSVTVPITLDHNRIIIDVRFSLPDGNTTRVRAWLDTGNPDLWITERLAKKLGLELSGDTKEELMGLKVRTSQAPRELLIGGMSVPLADLKEARALLDRKSIGPGLSAEINVPSTILRKYDVFVDYPNRELTIAAPGTIHFEGTRAKAILNPQNGLIQIPGNIAGAQYNLGLDLGASFSLISSDVVSKLRTAHPRWPHMTGAVAAANMWGLDDEPRWELVRIPSLEYGGITLTSVGVASFAKEHMDWFEQRAGVKTAGLIGASALLNYRVGINYARSDVYFQRIVKSSAPDMDVVGLTLRPEPDGRYSVIGVADFAGKPSVPDVKPGDLLVAIDKVPAAGGTMGQVWSLLGGRPGDVRILTLDRAGKRFAVKAIVHRFLVAGQQRAVLTNHPERRLAVDLPAVRNA